MTPERYHQINQLFHEALECAGEDRADFLKRACGGDDPLRLEVERMLAAHEQAGSFLNSLTTARSLIGEGSGEQLIGRMIGHYRILSKLGEGGMGEVLLAQDTKLERRIALKLLPAEFTSDRDRVRRFEREARAASALNHPNIITIHEIDQAEIESGHLHFIAQEFIEGQTLRRRIEEGVLPLLNTLDVAIQAASALEVAHAADIVHRDIKPENIMLRPDGFIKILDFGLAKLLEPGAAQSRGDSEDFGISGTEFRETAPGMILGTVAYMSPEQARGLKVDARSDIWSLGVVLYEMLTGRVPFKGKTMMDVIVSIINGEPPPLSGSLSQAPPELERIVMKALAKSCDERYQSIKDLGVDVKRLKQRLEFDAELARVSQPVTTAESHAARSRTEEQIVRRTGRLVPNMASRRSLLRLRVLLPLLVFAIGFFAWLSFRPASQISIPTPTPERQITYWLTVQRMRDGLEYEEPFASAGREVFESGWKFRLNGVSTQPGHFYLLNESPTSGGAAVYSLLFPSPSINNGSAQVSASQPIETGWYFFGGRKGTERLWLVWAAQGVSELESVKGAFNPGDRGVINNRNRIDAIRELLNRYFQTKPEVDTDEINRRTEVKVRAELLVHRVELEHR